MNRKQEREIVAVDQDLWERGFQLAYFLFPERNTALRILTGALNKLGVQRGREIRRSYWRDKHLKRAITRITRDESDALQWLIFSESDAVEKQQEESAPATQSQLVVRYIKHMVRMTTAMSSFYVNIGLHRLLYNYSTSDAQRVYESVTERFLGADEYRRAKSALMKKLLKRFAMLRTCRTQHGELRFETSEQQDNWAMLVDTCLRAFTPWSTVQACPVPVDYDAARDKLPDRLSGHGGERIDFNQVEINRCHAFIDPVCDARLMEALLMQPPREKLALPRFYMENERIDNDPTQPGNTSGLTPEERENISKELSGQAARRKRVSPQSMIVVVDGEERAQFPVGKALSQTIKLAEGDQLIEMRARFGGDDLLLAVHTLVYTESHGLAKDRKTLWRGRSGSFNLEIAPENPAGEEPARATATFSFQPSAVPWLTREFWQGRGALVPKVAFLAFIVAMASLLSVRLMLRLDAFKQSPAAVSQSPLPLQSPPPAAVTPATNPSATPLPLLATARIRYKLVPADIAVRSAGGSSTIVAIPKHSSLIELELPVDSDSAHRQLRASLKLFFQPSEIVSQEPVRAIASKGGAIVVFTVPSGKLKAATEYQVELETINQEGKFETVQSYGFATGRKK